MKTSIQTDTAKLADGATRDAAETKFLDWRPMPEEIAVLPELTLGGVQMDLTQALVRDAQEGWLGNPPGTLRAKLDAFLAETAITTEHASNSVWRQVA